jgi:bifunctional non-homologous end joining protein LigD
VGLREYRSKRQFSKTPEPTGLSARSGPAPRFVIQKHQARRLHYDFRLEVDGVLKSWAVPKGLSLDPEDKRLAVMVEDHPLDYGDFEGVIPKGNYGAGTVMLWDTGTYTLPGVSDGSAVEAAAREGLRKGRMHIILQGSKIKGEFALFQIRGTDSKNWLLRKIADQYATQGAVAAPDDSAKSGRSMAEITTGSQTAPAKARINLRGIPRGPMPERVKPMLASPVREPFDREGWLFEVKWDGYRAIAQVKDGNVLLYSRRGLSFAKRYPAVTSSLAHLGHDAVLDGEVVVVDEHGKSQFQLLQDYANLRNGNLLYYVFDLLYLDGHDLTKVPLVRRKEILAQLIQHLANVRLSDDVETYGRAFFQAVADKQLEGIVAKEAQSIYRPGIRGPSWQKIKAHRRQEAVIGGLTKPTGERSYFGSLVLGVYDKNDLVYVGHVGSGFSEHSLENLHVLLEARLQSACPFKQRPKTNSPARWVKPDLVCEVSYDAWTRDRIMRHPVFVGLREDVPAEGVRRQDTDGPEPEAEKAAAVQASSKPMANSYPDSIRLTLDGQTLQLTNQNKVYWPEERYTKHDLVEYYRQVANFILPYLVDRPESLHRHPAGITGKSFFQKDISSQKPPSWVPTVMLQDEPDEKVTQAVLCQNEATLVYLANLGCIELNPWNSRVSKLDFADYLMLDLDPEAIAFERVIEAAQVIHRILDKLEVESVCKTSGKRGLHIYVPLGAKYTHEQAKQFAELLAMTARQQLPETTSLERNPRSRQKRVYLDFLQNGRGKTLAAAYCVRPYPGATVSTPLKWSEVRPGLDPSTFTIRTVPDRLQKVGDLWQSVLGKGLDLDVCLGRMAAVVQGKAGKAAK